MTYQRLITQRIMVGFQEALFLTDPSRTLGYPRDCPCLGNCEPSEALRLCNASLKALSVLLNVLCLWMIWRWGRIVTCDIGISMLCVIILLIWLCAVSRSYLPKTVTFNYLSLIPKFPSFAFYFNLKFYLGMCVYVHLCVGTCVCACVWRSAECHSLGTVHIIFWDRTSHWPETCQVG